MSVLVSGGTGFIGTNLCRALLATGFDVKTFSINSGRYEPSILDGIVVLDKVDKISGDIRKLKDIRKASKDVDYIFHLAAYIPRPRAKQFDDPLKTFNVNALGTINLLEAARLNDVDKIIYSSTQAVYGKPKHLPVNENHSTNPTTFYGQSKLVGEQYCRQYQEQYGLHVYVLRYSYVYGPLQQHTTIVSLFARNAERGIPITLHGGGSQFFDFVSTDDVTQANIACLKKRCASDTFNISSGMPFSIKDLANYMITSLQSRSTIVYDQTLAEGYSIYLDNQKAQKRLGYVSMSPKEGLDKYLTWRGRVEDTSDV